MSMKCGMLAQANDEIKHAWAAGFFDGDGCTSITRQQVQGRKNETFRLRLTIAQNCLETLQVFEAVIGEKAHVNSPPETLATNRPIHYLIYTGLHAVAALRKMLPYLVRKQMGARAALAFWEEGRMGTLPGPKGLPAEVWKRRLYWFKKIKMLSKR